MLPYTILKGLFKPRRHLWFYSYMGLLKSSTLNKSLEKFLLNMDIKKKMLHKRKWMRKLFVAELMSEEAS